MNKIDHNGVYVKPSLQTPFDTKNQFTKDITMCKTVTRFRSIKRVIRRRLHRENEKVKKMCHLFCRCDKSTNCKGPTRPGKK